MRDTIMYTYFWIPFSVLPVSLSSPFVTSPKSPPKFQMVWSVFSQSTVGTRYMMTGHYIQRLKCFLTAERNNEEWYETVFSECQSRVCISAKDNDTAGRTLNQTALLNVVRWMFPYNRLFFWLTEMERKDSVSLSSGKYWWPLRNGAPELMEGPHG